LVMQIISFVKWPTFIQFGIMPGCFQTGLLKLFSEKGDILAIGLPLWKIIRVSPCSTSVIKAEAFCRKSVNVTVFLTSHHPKKTLIDKPSVAYLRDWRKALG